jgi:heme/copper-type cytochrome/quinol oxidase subunit 3
MSTALEHMHEVDLPFRVARARAGVIMLILSDALSIVAILAAGGYLTALNVEGQFRASGDHPPTFLPGLLLAIVLVLSGLSYYWWAREVRKNGGAGQLVFFILAFALIVIALVGQIWISRTLGYTTQPFSAYESLVFLLTWYSAVHLLLTAIIGLLLLVRLLRGRVGVAGSDYVAQTAGYWWYYTIIAGLLMWLFLLALR